MFSSSENSIRFVFPFLENAAHLQQHASSVDPWAFAGVPARGSPCRQRPKKPTPPGDAQHRSKEKKSGQSDFLKWEKRYNIMLFTSTITYCLFFLNRPFPNTSFPLSTGQSVSDNGVFAV